MEIKQNTKEPGNPVDLIIVIAGSIVGILILFGFIRSLISVFSWHSPVTDVPTMLPQDSIQTTMDSYPTVLPNPVTETLAPGIPSGIITVSGNTITEADNNTRHKIAYPADIVIDLPQSLYPKENLLIFGNPQGTLTIANPVATSKPGRWTVTLRTANKGAGDIIVQTKTDTASDFHVSFIIQ